MNETIPPGWADALEPVLASPQARQLTTWLQDQEDGGKVIFPKRGQRLRALELTPLEKVKVVVLGQDPYHGPGQAHGLCFSVPDGVPPPPSLENIFKELEADYGILAASNGNLEDWARRGVLLLNNTLTVEQAKAGSHARKGWEAITDACIAAVAQRDEPCVFILWGSHAQGKAERIAELRDGERHLLIKSPHPSPLSSYRGFFGSKPFSRANEFLVRNGREPVDWRL